MDFEALWLTLRLAVGTTAILLVMALPLAWWIASGRGVGRDGASTTSVVEDAMDRFGLRALTMKRPGALTVGERQRVAVVRAVTAAVCLGPGTLVLLDEPFTGWICGCAMNCWEVATVARENGGAGAVGDA
jgi:ABC-type uncharacterized transport system YnjBCD ATPase subunit